MILKSRKTNRKFNIWKSKFAILLVCALLWNCVPEIMVKAQSETMLSGMCHVQTFGNKNDELKTENGIATLVLGTRGIAKRVECVTINFVNNTGYEGTMIYRVHRQTYGWTNWISAGKPAGTVGQGKRLEGIQIKLTGELEKYYSVRYCAHIQTYGDSQGWVYNGALAGTTGEAKRLEEIKVQIIPKQTISESENAEGEVPTVSYRTHIQTYGWEKIYKKNGATSGTTGNAKRLEGIEIRVEGNQYTGGIEYCTHVQSYGWMDWVSDGIMSGTSGQAKRLEAIRIRLTGELEEHYDVYYRVHAQSFGWLAWAKNGEYAGTSGLSKRLEAIQIVLVRKDEKGLSNKDADMMEYSYIDEDIYYYDIVYNKLLNKKYNGLGNDIVTYARQFVGTPYVYGGADLKKGIDCSGFTMKVYENFGYTLYHLVSLQYKAGRVVSIEDAQPGDLFIYKTGDKTDFLHVEMYCGNAEIIGSADGGVSEKWMYCFGIPDYVVRIIK